MRLRVGQRVRLASTGEVGVVVWLWHNADVDATDAYVAFIGNDWPVGAPTRKPYVLRYLADSLEALQDAPSDEAGRSNCPPGDSNGV